MSTFTRQAFLSLSIVVCSLCSRAQGTWTPLTNLAPAQNGGVMLLLPDGTVMMKNILGGGWGTGWNKLTPDSHGSYVNGSWSTLASLHNERCYFSTQVLKDGRVYLAGGEYGTGQDKCELYNPMTDTWTSVTYPAGENMEDANSDMLPDGRVLQGTVTAAKHSYIFDPVSNTFHITDSSNGLQRESSWVKLRDNSILMVNWIAYTAERYIPSLNQWIADAPAPVMLYEMMGNDAGPGILLPDGRALYIGGSGATAYYTPSGTASPGTWVAGPHVPGSLGMPDGAAAMLTNGRILCATGPYSSIGALPTWLFEFDYVANTFTPVVAPDGGDSLYVQCFATNMLALPDGNILFSTQNSLQYYVYTPGGTPLAAGKPVIDSIMMIDCSDFRITGKVFNGIYMGAVYGDDWQMNTNFPLVRLTSGPDVYYARTHDWNRTAIQTGTLPDTAIFTLPASMPDGIYSLEVVVNGIASTPVVFKTCGVLGVEAEAQANTGITVYPNPAHTQAGIQFGSACGGRYDLALIDIFGRTVRHEQLQANTGSNNHTLDLKGMAKGIYTIVLRCEKGVNKATLAIR